MATLQDLKRGLIDAHRMGDTVRARQLAMSIRLMEAPAMDAVPVAGQFGVQSRRRPLTMGERATEFSAGAGKAYGQAVRDITQQAERFGERYMEAVQDPRTGRIPFAPLAMAGYGAVQDIAAGIEPIVRNPAILGEMATGMAQQAVSGPQGAGEVFGALVSPTQIGKAFQGPVMQELTTYHGTPHVFAPEEGAPLGRFRASQIGTGEGAQAYGHGIYVAESPGVAEQYKRNLTAANVSLDGKPLASLNTLERAAADYATEYGGVKRALETLDNTIARGSRFDDIDWLRQVREKLATSNYEKNDGSLYTVDLPDPMIERMLDYDAPLANQPASVREAVSEIARQLGVSEAEFDKGPLGPTIVRAGMERQLQSLGVPGIRYFDAGSRDSAKGTRNFVIFPGEEQNLTILQRE